MKILMLFIFFSGAFAETNTMEEPKAEVAEQEQQELKIEDTEVVEDISEVKPETKEEKLALEEKKESEKPASKEEAESKQAESILEEVSEIELVSTVETGAEVSSAQQGVKYVCDEGKSYTLYEPGNDSNHLCELDAGHTEQPAGWYALNDSSFCKGKMEELISQYNCVQKKD